MILTPEEKKKFETQLKAFQNMLTDLTQKVSEAKIITPEILKEHEMAISTMKKLKNGFCPSCGAPGQSGTCAYCGTTLPTLEQEKPKDILSKEEPVVPSKIPAYSFKPVSFPKLERIDPKAFENATIKPVFEDAKIDVKPFDYKPFENLTVYINPELLSNLKFGDDIAYKLRKFDIPDHVTEIKVSPTAKFANDFVKTESSWKNFEKNWQKIMEKIKDFGQQNK